MPLEDDLLDPTLADIARDTDTRDTNYWLAQTTKRGDEIRDKALTRLVNRGILEAESEDIFLLSRLVSRSRRYPPIDGKTLEEVRLRIMRVLYTDEIPDPRRHRHYLSGRCLRRFQEYSVLFGTIGGTRTDRTDSKNGPDRPIGYQSDPKVRQRASHHPSSLQGDTAGAGVADPRQFVQPVGQEPPPLSRQTIPGIRSPGLRLGLSIAKYWSWRALRTICLCRAKARTICVPMKSGAPPGMS